MFNPKGLQPSSCIPTWFRARNLARSSLVPILNLVYFQYEVYEGVVPLDDYGLANGALVNDR